jgi:predicted metal-dependent HD superfamily phosphohydrolase
MDTGKANWPINPELINSVREKWFNLAGKYSNDTELVQKMFSEIECAYNSADRHYHNIGHIDNLLYLSDQYKSFLKDKDAVDFSIFYHDFVYSVGRSDNEDKSAYTAKKRLADLNLPHVKIESVVHFIHATQVHQLTGESNESDLAWFLDFDMSVLSEEWDKYLEYTRQVRKEYSIYPDFLYKQGRKKFLQQTLGSLFIFHTSLFRNYQEQQARENMRKELEGL